MPRPALDRSVLDSIDVSKLGPDSPYHALIAKAGKRRTGASRNLEHFLQVRVMEWVRENEQRFPSLTFLFAVPNGGHRSVAVAGKLKAEGVRRGVPDLLFPVGRGRYVGLAIELKVKPNRLTTEQKLWFQLLRQQGWLCEDCYSFEDARDLILAYLSGASAR